MYFCIISFLFTLDDGTMRESIRVIIDFLHHLHRQHCHISDISTVRAQTCIEAHLGQHVIKQRSEVWSCLTWQRCSGFSKLHWVYNCGLASRHKVHCQTCLGKYDIFQFVAKHIEMCSLLQINNTYRHDSSSSCIRSPLIITKQITVKSENSPWEKCQDYLLLIVIWLPRDLWSEPDSYLSQAV